MIQVAAHWCTQFQFSTVGWHSHWQVGCFLCTAPPTAPPPPKVYLGVSVISGVSDLVGASCVWFEGHFGPIYWNLLVHYSVLSPSSPLANRQPQQEQQPQRHHVKSTLLDHRSSLSHPVRQGRQPKIQWSWQLTQWGNTHHQVAMEGWMRWMPLDRGALHKLSLSLPFSFFFFFFFFFCWVQTAQLAPKGSLDPRDGDKKRGPG